MRKLFTLKKIRFITEAAVIASIYAALTIILAPISYGMFQVRISEALTILPYLTPAAIPGLFAGCIIANIVGGNGPIDIIFGSLATLIAAFLSYKMPRRYLVPIPPIVINAVVVGAILSFLLKLDLLVSMGWVALGQTVACYGLGYPLLLQLEKHKRRIFG
jgi:uncharacterized membrane protein